MSGGAFTIAVTRIIQLQVEVEVEAPNRDDATDYAIKLAKSIPLDQWSVKQDDCDIVALDDMRRAR